jgi:hypothetical protein
VRLRAQQRRANALSKRDAVVFLSVEDTWKATLRSEFARESALLVLDLATIVINFIGFASVYDRQQFARSPLQIAFLQVVLISSLYGLYACASRAHVLYFIYRELIYGVKSRALQSLPHASQAPTASLLLHRGSTTSGPQHYEPELSTAAAAGETQAAVNHAAVEVEMPLQLASPGRDALIPVNDASHESLHGAVSGSALDIPQRLYEQRVRAVSASGRDDDTVTVRLRLQPGRPSDAARATEAAAEATPASGNVRSDSDASTTAVISSLAQPKSVRVAAMRVTAGAARRRLSVRLSCSDYGVQISLKRRQIVLLQLMMWSILFQSLPVLGLNLAFLYSSSQSSGASPPVKLLIQCCYLSMMLGVKAARSSSLRELQLHHDRLVAKLSQS